MIGSMLFSVFPLSLLANIRRGTYAADDNKRASSGILHCGPCGSLLHNLHFLFQNSQAPFAFAFPFRLEKFPFSLTLNHILEIICLANT
jgi:hypothetical protein